MARDYWAENGELIQVQSVQPGPRMQPGPLDQDAIRGYGARQPRQSQRPSQPSPRPRQALPQPSPAAEEGPAPMAEQQPAGDPTKAWGMLMRKHGIEASRWGDYVDKVYGADRDGTPPKTGNQALDSDLYDYAKRFPGIGRYTPPAAGSEQKAPAINPKQAGPRDYWSENAGIPQQEAPAAAVRPAPNKLGSTSEPDAPTWLGRRVQDLRGKQDPAMNGIPNIASVIQQRGQSWGDIGGETASWLMGASDEDMARTYQAMLGRDFVRTEADANGYPVIVYRDNGQEKRAYVNTPGLDMQDVARGAYGALPFAKVGAMVAGATKGMPLVGRVFAQGGGQAATSLGQDAAAVGTGVSDFNPVQSAVKAGVAGTVGMGAEVVGAALSPLIRRFVTEPKYYNRATGTLTPEGEAAARAAGLEPETFTQQIAKEFSTAFAKTGNAEGAFRQAVSKEAGIRRSAGELTGDVNQLLREQQMRGGTYGAQSREIVRDFDEMQRADIVRATRGTSPPGRDTPTIPSMIAPERNYQLARGIDKAQTGENISRNNSTAYALAKEQERAKWDAVPSIKATPDALAELDGTISRTFESRGGILVDDSVTPMAAKMAKELQAFKAGEVPSKVSEILPSSPAGDVQMMRKRLLAMRKSAQTDEDRRASRALYDSFIDWEVTAAEKSGDLVAAAKSRAARDATRELHEIFDGPAKTPAANILKQVLKTADTPEGIVNALFTGPTAEIKGGSLTALRQLKKAYDTYLDPAASQTAWNDIRLAYWIKMTSDRGNEAKNPAALASSIKAMIGTQGSIARELYTPAEIAAMRRLAVAMDDIKRKNPNTSWSAIGVGALMRDVGNAALKMIGWDSVTGRVVAGTLAKPVSNTLGKVRAQNATGGLQGATLPELPGPSLGGYGGALGAQSQQ